jgi:hypothetical protein
MEQAGVAFNSFTTTILLLTRIGLQAVLCRIVFKTLAVPVGAVTDALSSSR